LLEQGLKKSPIGQKLDFANHPYFMQRSLCVNFIYTISGKEGGKNDYINIENVGNTSLHVVVSNDKGHVITHDHFSPTWRFFKPSLSPARTRFKEITNWAKIGFC
jgi:hypothetical protein